MPKRIPLLPLQTILLQRTLCLRPLAWAQAEHFDIDTSSATPFYDTGDTKEPFQGTVPHGTRGINQEFTEHSGVNPVALNMVAAGR